MAIFCGPIRMACPQCGQPLEIPIVSDELTTGPDGSTGIRIELDKAYVEAHVLTHGPHDGEPLAAAA